jgi:hypothetical protein
MRFDPQDLGEDVGMGTDSYTEATYSGDCPVCMGRHDEGIHSATLSLHQWFRQRVTRYFVDEAEREARELEAASREPSAGMTSRADRIGIAWSLQLSA